MAGSSSQIDATGDKMPGVDRLRQVRRLLVGLRDWSRRRRRGYVAEQATRDHWETSYSSGAWERLREVAQLAHYSQIVGYCTYFSPGGAILDIGCGEGVLQEKLRPYGYRHYVGIDIAAEAIRRAAVKQDASTEFFQADATAFEHSLHFDVIVFNECLYYFADPVGLLRKYERLLSDAGVFIISMYGVERTEQLWNLVMPLYPCEDAIQLSHQSGKLWTVRVFRPLHSSGTP